MSRLYRINQLVGELNISKSSIYLWVSQGNFPAPFKIGGGTSCLTPITRLGIKNKSRSSFFITPVFPRELSGKMSESR